MIRRTPARVLWAVALAAAWLGPALAGAQAPDPPPPAPIAEMQPPPEPVPPVEIPEPTTAVPVPPAGVAQRAAEGRVESEAHRGWLDHSHRFLEAAVFWPFIQLDDFFASERQVRPKAPGSLIHWRQDLIARASRAPRACRSSAARRASPAARPASAAPTGAPCRWS